MRWWFRQQFYTQIVIGIGHTTCNVSGDLCGTTIMASHLRMMDAAVFNDWRNQEDQFCE